MPTISRLNWRAVLAAAAVVGTGIALAFLPSASRAAPATCAGLPVTIPGTGGMT